MDNDIWRTNLVWCPFFAGDHIQHSSVSKDGLVWRSRQTKEGMRRVNYYVKHLIQDPSDS